MGSERRHISRPGIFAARYWGAACAITVLALLLPSPHTSGILAALLVLFSAWQYGGRLGLAAAGWASAVSWLTWVRFGFGLQYLLTAALFYFVLAASAGWASETVQVQKARLLDAKEKVRTRGKWLETITENMRDMLSMTDARGELTYVSASHRHGLGLDPEELLGKNVLELVHPEDRYRAEAIFDQGSRGSAPGRFEIRVQDREGNYRWLETVGNPVLGETGEMAGAVFSTRDVTGRKELEHALRRSEEKFRTIVENANDIVVMLNRQGELTYVSPRLKSVLGHEPGEVRGRPVTEFVHEEDVDRCLAALEQAADTGRPIHGLEFRVIGRNGQIKWLEASGSPLQDADSEPVLLVIGRDISERKRYERQLEYLSLRDHLTGLYNRAYFEDVLYRLSKGRDRPITLISLDLDGLKLVNDVLGHQKGDELLQGCAQVLQESLRGSDILARTGGDEFGIILPQTDAESAQTIMTRIWEQVKEYNRKQHREGDGLPLSVSAGVATAEDNQKTLGVIFDQADSWMYSHKLRKGAESHSELIGFFLAELKKKDFQAKGHAERVGRWAVAMAQALNWADGQLSRLSRLAQVHDLGHVGVPDRVLLKPGPLQEEEWEVIRLHPEKGYRIAQASRDYSDIADLILKHHERWDGQGYPLGLRQQEIPVECRLFAVVDAFDAMTSDRPYRKAMNADLAAEELRRHAGTQFDPEMVKVFLGLKA